MAEKEATVYIVDVSRSMGKKNHGRDESDLEWALRYVWDKITTTISTGRKTATLGVIGLGTDDSNNELAHSDEAYQHISVIQPISQILMPELRHLRQNFQCSRTDSRDAISSVILAIQLIERHCKQNQWIRRIILITNGTGYIDPDDHDQIVKKVQKDGIELTVLGIDFDDEEYGFEEENKHPTKRANEEMLRQLVQACGGVFGTMKEATENLDIPRIKAVKPMPSFKGSLLLGDTQTYDNVLVVEIERYPKVMIARPPTASAYVMKTGSSQGPEDNLTAVHNTYTYTIKDENDGKREVPRDQLAKGYEYGRTAVHISETDQNITKLETEQAYEILGFIKTENVERYMLIDSSNMIVAQRTNDKAAIALSSLIRSLLELESCAIARVVKKDGSDPLLTLLSPSVTPDYECLIENQLPFAEDVRSYRFPPLDKVITVAGKKLTSPRNLPGDDLVSAMDNFVDSMDLSNIDGQEFAAIEDTYSPVLHRLHEATKYRAVFPSAGIPAVPEILVRYSKPPTLPKRAALQALINAADVKKVPPKAKGRRRLKEAETPLSGLDVEELFKKEKRSKIDPNNAVAEFKQALAATDSLDVVKEVVKQMASIVQDLIRNSFGDSAYGRGLECIGVMRQELIEFEEPVLFNNFLRELKKKLLSEELNGNRRDMWHLIRKSRMGLIDKRMSSVSDVTQQDADDFMAAK